MIIQSCKNSENGQCGRKKSFTHENRALQAVQKHRNHRISFQNFAQSTKFEIRLNFDKVVTLIPNSVHRNPGATPI